MGEPIITRELVRDPCEIVFEDGSRYATQRWITRCSDIRETPFGKADFGWWRIGDAFLTPDSVPSPFYEPPTEPIWRRLTRWLSNPPSPR